MTDPERKNRKTRCSWVPLSDPAYVKYHDEEWGKPLHDDRALYELLILEMFQAGLSWRCILHKRENFRKAYEGFYPEKTAAFDTAKVDGLMADPGIIRNRRKIEASIRNSQIFCSLQKEFGSFDAYLWRFTGGRTLREPCDERTTSPVSDALAKDLYRRGMRFVGSTTMYSYLQSAGLINGHMKACYLAPE